MRRPTILEQIQALDPAARNSLRAGMPAIVDLPRQTSGSPWHGLSAWPW